MIQNGYGGANGSGYLADIHFHAFGPVCETSFINFSGHCVLLDTEGNKIPATWQNATVHVSPPPEWTPMDSGTPAYLWGIWGTNSSDVFAVSGGGTILHYDGTGWAKMDSVTKAPLHSIWGSSSSDVFAVGGYDRFLRGTNTWLIALPF